MLRPGGRLAGDRGGGIHVVAIDDLCTERLFDRRERAERHHFAVAIADFEAVDVVWFGPIVGLGLNAHLVHAAKFVEVVDVARAQIGLHRAEHFAQRNIEQLYLFAIYVDVHLRHAGAKRGIERGETGLGASVFDDPGHDLTQNVAAKIAAVLHFHLEAAAHAQATNGRRRERKHDGLLNRAELCALRQA